MRPRIRDAGFTLTELMIVVVIIGVMAAVSMPYLGRDRMAREGREYARELARDLQRSRSQALTDRGAIRAAVFGDRVEFRNLATGDLLRVLWPKPGMVIWDVTPNVVPATPPAAPVLSSAVSKQVDFTTLGQSQLVGDPPLTGASIFFRNGNVPNGHQERDFRIDITALTAFVAVRYQWN